MKFYIFLIATLTLGTSSTLIHAGNLSVIKCVGPDGQLYFTDTGCPELQGAKVETYTIQNATLSPTAQAESLKRQAQTLYREAENHEIRGSLPSEVRNFKRQAEALEREAGVVLGERGSAVLTKEEKVIQALEDQQDSARKLSREQDEEAENKLRAAENKVRHAEHKARQAEFAAHNAELQAKRNRKFERLGVPR